MASQQSNIAIIGAGIGGLALAIGLTHHKIPFTIYESAAAFSTVGAGIGLGPNALRAMDLIDERFRNMYMKIATGNLKPEKKHVMMEAMRMEEGLGKGETWWTHGEWGAPYFERTGAHRKDLLDVMTSFIDMNSVQFNKTVASIEQTDNQVVLTFTDGCVAGHITAVGCDGIKGLTRRAVLAEQYPELVKPQYTNKYVYRTVISIEDAKKIMGDLATDAKMFMSKNFNLSIYPISKGTQVNVVAFKRDEGSWQHDGNTYDVERRRMMEDFAETKVDGRLLKLLEVSVITLTKTPQMSGTQACHYSRDPCNCTCDVTSDHSALTSYSLSAQRAGLFLIIPTHQPTTNLWCAYSATSRTQAGLTKAQAQDRVLRML